MLAHEGEIFDNYVLKLAKAIKLSEIDCQLDFITSKGDKDEVENNRSLFTGRRTALRGGLFPHLSIPWGGIRVLQFEPNIADTTPRDSACARFAAEC